MVRSTRITIIRHGQAQAAVDQIVGGHKGCTGLSLEGRRQAEALRDRLLRTDELRTTDVVLTSVLPRAIETATIISPGVGTGDLDIAQDCELCELHPGECDGWQWAEFNERYPDLDMGADPYVPLSPGGESIATFFARAGAALRAAVDRYEGQQIVIVAHGGVIRASFTAFGNLPTIPSFELVPINTSLTEWRGERVDNQWHWLLERYNDAAHLTAT